MRKHALAAVHQQVGDKLEALLAAVIGIGNIRDAELLPGAEIRHPAHLVHVFPLRIEPFHVCKVLRVHNQDKVEVGEIVGGELPGLARALDAALADGPRHAVVRRVADVVVVRTGGVDFHRVLQPGVAEHVPKDVFPRR